MSYKRALILGYMGNENNNLEEFQSLGRALLSKEITGVIPHYLFEIDFIEKISVIEITKKIVADLLTCEIVYTMKNWEEEPVNLKVIEIARKLEIPVEVYLIKSH